MEFKAHTSKELVDLFRNKPFQGARPEDAKIIFLSSDANYSPEISNDRFFEYILEYQENGIEFWKKYGKHHPFLIDEYPFNKTKNGRPFHNNFQKIGLDGSYAEYISFVELLDIPTIGNKSDNRPLFYTLANREHLERIDNLINVPSNRLVFTSSGVLKDMREFKKRYRLFKWLPNEPLTTKYRYSQGSNELQQIYHFSSSHIHTQLTELKIRIDNWLAKFANKQKQADA